MVKIVQYTLASWENINDVELAKAREHFYNLIIRFAVQEKKDFAKVIPGTFLEKKLIAADSPAQEKKEQELLNGYSLAIMLAWVDFFAASDADVSRADKEAAFAVFNGFSNTSTFHNRLVTICKIHFAKEGTALTPQDISKDFPKEPDYISCFFESACAKVKAVADPIMRLKVFQTIFSDEKILHLLLNTMATEAQADPAKPASTFTSLCECLDLVFEYIDAVMPELRRKSGNANMGLIDLEVAANVCDVIELLMYHSAILSSMSKTELSEQQEELAYDRVYSLAQTHPLYAVYILVKLLGVSANENTSFDRAHWLLLMQIALSNAVTNTTALRSTLEILFKHEKSETELSTTSIYHDIIVDKLRSQNLRAIELLKAAKVALEFIVLCDANKEDPIRIKKFRAYTAYYFPFILYAASLYKDSTESVIRSEFLTLDKLIRDFYEKHQETLHLHSIHTYISRSLRPGLAATNIEQDIQKWRRVIKDFAADEKRTPALTAIYYLQAYRSDLLLNDAGIFYGMFAALYASGQNYEIIDIINTELLPARQGQETNAARLRVLCHAVTVTWGSRMSLLHPLLELISNEISKLYLAIRYLQVVPRAIPQSSPLWSLLFSAYADIDVSNIEREIYGVIERMARLNSSDIHLPVSQRLPDDPCVVTKQFLTKCLSKSWESYPLCSAMRDVMPPSIATSQGHYTRNLFFMALSLSIIPSDVLTAYFTGPGVIGTVAAQEYTAYAAKKYDFGTKVYLEPTTEVNKIALVKRLQSLAASSLSLLQKKQLTIEIIITWAVDMALNNPYALIVMLNYLRPDNCDIELPYIRAPRTQGMIGDLQSWLTNRSTYTYHVVVTILRLCLAQYCNGANTITTSQVIWDELKQALTYPVQQNYPRLTRTGFTDSQQQALYLSEIAEWSKRVKLVKFDDVVDVYVVGDHMDKENFGTVSDLQDSRAADEGEYVITDGVSIEYSK